MDTTTYITVSSGLISLNFGWWAYLQRTAKKELVESASRWLKGSYSQSAVNEWRDHLTLTFDRTFGLEPFSKDFLVQSAKVTFATTVIVVSIVLLTAIFFAESSMSETIKEFFYGKKGAEKDWVSIYSGIPGAFLYNLVPDFLSLCETRFVLSYLHRVSGAKRLIGYLIIDLILSTGIFLVWFVLVFGMTFTAYPNSEHGATVPDILASSLMFGAVLGVISNYLSSGWIWFYGIAGPISRFFNGLLRGKATAISLKYLNIDEKPFDYLALLTSVILAIFLLLTYAALRPSVIHSAL